MKSSNLLHLGGLATLLGGLLLVVRAILHILDIGEPTGYPLSEVAMSWSFALVYGLGLFGYALLLVGLVGLYAAQSKRAGILGLVSFVILFSGVAMTMARQWFELFMLPAAAVDAPEWVDSNTTVWQSFGLTLPELFTWVGWFLFAVAILRARIYPLVAIVGIILNLMVAALSLPAPLDSAGSLIRNAAIAGLGFALLTGRIGSSEDPLPAVNLVRWGARAAILAGAVWAVSIPVSASDVPASYRDAVFNLALVCTLGGLVGLHELQAKRYGRLGQLGFYSAFTGITLIVLGPLSSAHSVVLVMVYLIGALSMIVGAVLLGVAVLRARILPRWCGLLLVLSPPLLVIVDVAIQSVVVIRSVVVDDVGRIGMGVTLGLVCLALGYALLAQREEEAPKVGTLQKPSGAVPEAE